MKHNLTGKKDADRILRNMVIGIDGIPQAQKGDEIIYWTGDFSDEVGLKPVGREAKKLEVLDRVILSQRKIASKMMDAGAVNVYEYMALVR